MKKLSLYGYSYADAVIKRLEMIDDSLNNDIENYLGMMEDDAWVDDVESARKIFASFAVAVRRNADQVGMIIGELKLRAEEKLCVENKGKEISVVNNYELQKQYANFR
jgi:K+/H+ antiporter YhaU regulatory subunit KhtT